MRWLPAVRQVTQACPVFRLQLLPQLCPIIIYGTLTTQQIQQNPLLYFRNPEEGGLYPPCLFYALTGLHCPGCGTLRGLHQLLNGNLLAAFGYNPYTMLALPVLGYAYLAALLLTVAGKRLPTVFLPPALIWGLLAAVLAFWALRNVPVYPLTVLAP